MKFESKTNFPRNTKWVKNKYREWSCIYPDRSEQSIKHSFSLKYEAFLKSIASEGVFAEKEMNDEWNADFLQNMSCVWKVTKLKLYLPRHKWTMKEA